MFNNIKGFLNTRKIIKDACKNEQLLEKLTTSFGNKFKIDKLGRIYTVINPIIQNLNNNGNTLIFTDFNMEKAVNDYLMRNLNMLKSFIGENKFFDILTYNISKLDDDENYLIVLESIFLKPTIKFFKRFLYFIISLILIGITILILI